MTSFIAAGGSGRSASFIPAVPAAWSVTTIAFMGIVSSVICNADDRLSLASLGPAEGGARRVEGRGVADVRPQSAVTHPLDDLTQLGAIGHENKVDRQAVGGPGPGRPRGGPPRSSGSQTGRRRLSCRAVPV